MKKGFTLIEAILYLAIAGTVLYFISGFAFNAIFGKSKIEALQEVDQTTKLIFDDIEDTLVDAIDFYTTSTTTDVGDEGDTDEASIVTALRVGLVGYWPFDGESLSDYSDNDITAQISNIAYTADGRVGGAYTFNGGQNVDGYRLTVSGVNVPKGGTPRTMAFWIKPANFYWGAIMQYGAALYYGWWNVKIYEGGSENLIWQRYGSDFNSESLLPVGEWSLVVLTYEDGLSNVYINQDNPTSYGDTLDTGTNTGDNLYFGDSPEDDWANDQWNSFDGILDEIAIWDRVLTPDEIAQLCNDTGSGCVGRSLIQN
jgi:type II secretory pathway pseudopilin PulG